MPFRSLESARRQVEEHLFEGMLSRNVRFVSASELGLA